MFFGLILVFGVKFLIPPYLGIFHTKCLDLMILAKKSTFNRSDSKLLRLAHCFLNNFDFITVIIPTQNFACILTPCRQYKTLSGLIVYGKVVQIRAMSMPMNQA